MSRLSIAPPGQEGWPEGTKCRRAGVVDQGICLLEQSPRHGLFLLRPDAYYLSSMTNTVQLQQMESGPLAVLRRQVKRADLSRVVPECCGLVWNALRAQNLRGGRNVAIYWDETIRIEVGVEMTDLFAERDGVVRSATPGGAVAWTTHHGPYGGLGGAHRAVQTWCRAHGHVPAGPNWEIYGHWIPAWNTDPSLIRTDVFYLVAPSQLP